MIPGHYSLWKKEKTYVNANGEEKKYAVLGVADSSMIAKCTLYDTSKLKVLQEGNSVMLLNVIVKDNNSLTLTTKSRISKVGDVKVSSERQKAAREIAFPPMSSEVPLKDIEKSPIKSMLSVRGQIVAEEITRTVSVKGRDTKVKSLTIKDDTGKCKVSLWRDLAASEIGIGQHVKISDVVVQTYNNEKSVSSTTRTIIEEVEAPRSTTVTSEIIAFNMEDSCDMSVVINDGELYPSYKVQSSIMAAYLNCNAEDLDDVLATKLPFQATFSIENGEIVNFE
uniref:Replication protein A 70 kDa DNA-binding subunit n=1 Tax=Magallana gigas TaxID=29159 RepID=K1Q8E2_MAGGI|eukprot:XP_011435649.1 PREDICTED: uncharacterized protein LOC105334049 [Crassostrea gigas]